jgi:hypothetical protein
MFEGKLRQIFCKKNRRLGMGKKNRNERKEKFLKQ